MGMDVMGRAPKSKEGSYFRASVWSWRPLHALMTMANDRKNGALIPDETLDRMGGNDGAGLRTQKRCDALAAELDRLLAHPEVIRAAGLVVTGEGNGMVISFPVGIYDMVCDKNGRLLTDKEAKGRKPEELHSPYEIGIEYAREWIAFLRACNGFKVC